MTSHIIDEFVNRSNTELRSVFAETELSDNCTFCAIVRGDQPAYHIFDGDYVIAILDILPIRPGHVLVIPKRHVSRLSDLPEDLAGEIGRIVTKISKALTLALKNFGLNVVCNQEYAQAVPHVHYHIVPAPQTNAVLDKRLISETDSERDGVKAYSAMLRAEFIRRDELEDDDAKHLVDNIRSKL